MINRLLKEKYKQIETLTGEIWYKSHTKITESKWVRQTEKNVFSYEGCWIIMGCLKLN